MQNLIKDDSVSYFPIQYLSNFYIDCNDDYDGGCMVMVNYKICMNIKRFLSLKNKIKEARTLALIGIAEAGSGHPGASFSAAEIMGSLYFQIMQFGYCRSFPPKP